MSDSDTGTGQENTVAAGNIVRCTVTASATVLTYPQKLLDVAKGLIDTGELSIAVVVAHIACEVATDRKFNSAFATRGIEDLEDPITAYFSGAAFSNDRNRKLYTALTGDRIQDQPFWERFTRSVKRRNDIAHKGAIAGKVEAEESLTTATEFVAHLER